MASTSSYFDPTSTFIYAASDTFLVVIYRLLSTIAGRYHASLSETIRAAFDGELLTVMTLDFKRYT